VPPPIAAVDQGPVNLCWLAATAVMFSWKDGAPCTRTEAANRFGVEFVAHQELAAH
jgi:hypothetical protein